MGINARDFADEMARYNDPNLYGSVYLKAPHPLVAYGHFPKHHVQGRYLNPQVAGIHPSIYGEWQGDTVVGRRNASDATDISTKTPSLGEAIIKYTTARAQRKYYSVKQAQAEAEDVRSQELLRDYRDQGIPFPPGAVLRGEPLAAPIPPPPGKQWSAPVPPPPQKGLPVPSVGGPPPPPVRVWSAPAPPPPQRSLPAPSVGGPSLPAQQWPSPVPAPPPASSWSAPPHVGPPKATPLPAPNASVFSNPPSVPPPLPPSPPSAPIPTVAPVRVMFPNTPFKQENVGAVPVESFGSATPKARKARSAKQTF